MPRLRIITLANFLVLAAAAQVHAQVTHSPAYPFIGDSAGDNFGASVSSAGDVDGDGYDDLIVGAYLDDNNGSNSGSARVFSGIDGTILYTFNGDSAGDFFGYSVSGAGDVNNDGFDDLIVGAYLDDSNGSASGSARVLSGATGAILYTFNGDSASDQFGYSVSGAGDVNNDGFDDIIVGAVGDDNTGADSGSARIFSGANGSILYTFNGDSAGDQFGWSVSGAGDVNNDGFDDLIFGARGDDNNGANSGSARVFSGANGSILYTFNGDSAGDAFGVSVSGAGDVNNDGFADLIVGAQNDDNNGIDSGSARVFSGASGSILYTFNGDSVLDNFGISVSGAGDVNNDGYADLMVGAWLDDNNGDASGSARVFSGIDGSVLYTFHGDAANDAFGISVSTAGDVNGDGFADLIVGANGNDSNGTNSGSAQVFYSIPQITPPVTCPGNANIDSIVNFEDINAVIANFNTACDPAHPPVLLVPAYPFYGDMAGDHLGYSVSGAGDVNNDGFADLIVGAPESDVTGVREGFARVFSGADGSILYTFNGAALADRFGYSVSGAGDVNNDGFADFIVGIPFSLSSGHAGSARVYSGAEGSVLYTFSGDSPDEGFGASVSGAGDVNGDGFADLIIGAEGDDGNGLNFGSARVFSGLDGTVLHTFNGDFTNERFGYSVSGVGDVNNDGFDDVIVGAPNDDNNGPDSGSARVFSGANGAILYTFNGDSVGDWFGYSVSGAGDVNNDGFDDLIVGAWLDDNNGSDSGSARVFSGIDGSILYTFDGDSAGDRFGVSVSGAGDVNNDGFDDLIVGAQTDDNNGSDSGSARVFSGANGSILCTANGDSAGDFFGYSVSGAGDVNGDGFADLIVGAHPDDNYGYNHGNARVFYSVLAPDPCPGDANDDTLVNFDDITAVIANWLNMCP